ncbi:hypothetical protein [Mycolicibacterium holsaticum]|uniref:hypothetical protein n=1 Tax=Mycolicibacterium holsaticum TaxID=152142 RepID=UPI00223D9939|nr:hypothetical protein [Mycolicibacterium holsaticum]UNC11848.1 hypothetical protein H5U41_11550 [Mycolicibacterium holsaticum DSM 44478 = JCM 12374]
MGGATPLWTVFVTAGAALFGAGLGAWIPVFRDKRTWQREHEKHWRDTRLEVYKEFLVAHREYLAYILLDGTKIRAAEHPRLQEMMPFFDEEGRPVRQRQEAAFTALRLVAMSQETEDTLVKLVKAARQIACARAGGRQPKDIDSKLFATASMYEQEFIDSARREMGLPPLERKHGSEARPAEEMLGAIPGETAEKINTSELNATKRSSIN